MTKNVVPKFGAATGSSGWRRIILHLAREPAFPDGSSRHGYAIEAPLDSEGHLNAEAWRASGRKCPVNRFWGAEPSSAGWLEHRRGGAGGASWIIDYDRASSDDDEAGYRLDHHAFRVGEYVTIAGNAGSHTFLVVEINAAQD